VSLNVHTSTAGLVYDSAPVQMNLLTQLGPKEHHGECSDVQKR
jgi:hypothetical protein